MLLSERGDLIRVIICNVHYFVLNAIEIYCTVSQYHEIFLQPLAQQPEFCSISKAHHTLFVSRTFMNTLKGVGWVYNCGIQKSSSFIANADTYFCLLLPFRQLLSQLTFYSTRRRVKDSAKSS